MPLLDPPTSPDAAAERWKATLSKAISNRLDASRLKTVFNDLSRQYPAPSMVVADVLFGLGVSGSEAADPLLSSYVALLLEENIITAAPTLLALLRHSDFVRPKKTEQPQRASLVTPTLEEITFQLVATTYNNRRMQNSSIKDDNFAQITFALVRWLMVLSDYETAKSLDESLHSPDQTRFSTYEALAMLVACVFNEPSFRTVHKQPWWKEKRAVVRNAIESFYMHVGQWMQTQNAPNLQALLSVPPFVETDTDGFPHLTAQQIIDSVSDLPVTHTRASMYIWLNACLCARQLTDDITMMQFLQSHGPGNVHTAAIDMLVAAFDSLTNAMLSRESRHSVKLIRSFICNRLPPLFVTASGAMLPATVETCVQMAFETINMDPLTPLEAGANDIREQLKLTRLEFLQACALHGLLTESTISAILRQPPITLPRVTKMTKEALVQQCAHNTGKLESLIDDLDSMQGNSGAIAACVVTTVNNLCNSKDTMSLKSVCMALIRKISHIDIIMQYAQPVSLLLPLCTILNDWVHDQDQSELQPPYEEFSTILLLVLAVISRYDLDKATIGISDDSMNIVGRLMQDQSTSVSPQDLSEEQKGRLAKWIEGLYTTDEHGETSGIGDEVMSHCPPQAFYELVPTLFEQSIMACKSKALPVNTLKGGLEFLLEPFLLPSLVGGLSWLIRHSWEDHNDADVLLQVLDKLLKPSSSSSDTQAMHKAILGIIGTPLTRSLEHLARQKPGKKEVDSLLKIVKPHTDQQRTLHAQNAIVNDWTSTPGGGIRQCIRNSIREIAQWIADVGPSKPPRFTFRLFATALDIAGVECVIESLVTELAEQTLAGRGAQTLEICTAMVFAPLPRWELSLQETLRLMVSDVKGLLSRPVSAAEAIIRLQRRVETHNTMILAAATAMPMPMQDQATEQIMQDLGLAADNAGSLADVSLDQVGGQAQEQTVSFDDVDVSAALDQSMNAALDQSMSAAGTNAAGMIGLDAGGAAGQQDQMQDIFGDLGVDLSNTSNQNQSLGGLDVSDSQDNNQQNQEEDIFAGLMDMDDFTFG